MPIKNGWSLLEILVAISLSSLLLALILKIYYLYIQAENSLQNTLHEYTEYSFIYRVLNNSVQRAGFTPCKSLNSLKSKENLQSFKILPTGIQLNSMHNPIAKINFVDSQHVIWPDKRKLDLTSVYLITDCYHAELSKIQSVYEEQDKKIVQLAAPLTQEFIFPIYMGVFLSETISLQHRPHSALVLHGLQNDTVSTEVKKFAVQAQERENDTVFTISITMNSGREYIPNKLQNTYNVVARRIAAKLRHCERSAATSDLKIKGHWINSMDPTTF